MTTIPNNSNKLREGYTTGTCAATAAKGATYGFIDGFIPDYVEIDIPAGKTVKLKIEEKHINVNYAECCVKKDAGDDPDVTNGALIYARVEQIVSESNNGNHTSKHAIQIEGGEGIGIVTKPGLQIEIGRPAINPVPQKMIKTAIYDVIGDDYDYGIKVTISVPGGDKIAKRTFNERLGICGGISIIGTTGVVKPMSEEAIKTSLKCELDIAWAMKYETVILAPGNLAENAVKAKFKLKNEQVVLMSNFVGYMLGQAFDIGFKNVIIAGHPGKLTKLIRGDFNTHSSKSKPANDIIIDLLQKKNIENSIIENSKKSTTIEGIIQEVKKHNKLNLFDNVAEMVENAASAFMNHKLNIGVILFDMQKQLIGVSPVAKEWKERNVELAKG